VSIRGFADRWPFRRKLNLLVGVPLAVVAVLLAYLIADEVGQSTDAEDAARLVRDSGQVAKLVNLVESEHQQAILLSVRFEATNDGGTPSQSAYRMAQKAVDDQVEKVRDTFGDRLPASEAQASQREKRIVHHEQARVRRKPGRPAMGHGRDRALGERGRDEIMAIETRSRESYEQIARLQGAAVDGNAGRLPRAGRLPTRGAGDVGRCPERGHASSFTAARASSLSSKGCVMPAIV